MLIIHDPGSVLNESDAHALTVKAAAYPFDIHVLISNGAGSRASFESSVAHAVTGPRMLAIGVDPTRHFSHVRGSFDLGLPSGPQVAQAGNPFFRVGNLVEGIDAIAAKANDLRLASQTITSQTGVPIVIHEQQTPAGLWWALCGIAVFMLGVSIWAWLRGRRRDRETLAQQAALAEEAAEFRARNMDEQEWQDKLRSSHQPTLLPSNYRATTQVATPLRSPSYSPPAPTVVVQSAAPQPMIVQGNNSGLDLLLSYELGRESSPSPRVEQEVVVERESESSSSSSWGGGGSESSSSYESDSSASSSSSSSDYSSSSDSSSSSDFGGGSDWGSSGGGSDW